jgi:hypothetical protein
MAGLMKNSESRKSTYIQSVLLSVLLPFLAVVTFVLGGALVIAPRYAHGAAIHGAAMVVTKKGAQKARDAVATVMSSYGISGWQRQAYLEEVIPYAIYFLGQDGDPSVGQVRSYLQFSADKIMPQVNEGSDKVAICAAVWQDPGCKECDFVTKEIIKKLPPLFVRRGFQYRPIAMPAVAEAEGAGYSTDYTTPEAYDNYALLAAEGGCVNMFYVGVGAGDRGAVKAAFFLDVKDRAKRRLRAEYQVSELVFGRNQQDVFTPAEALLAHGTAQVFARVGADLVQELQAAQTGPEKYLVLEGIKSFQDYITFKRKLVDGVQGLTALEEHTMTGGRVEFIVLGAVPLSTINARLLQIIGPDPVISDYNLESEVRMKVVLK